MEFSISVNGKNLVAHALTNFDWNVLETLNYIDLKTSYLKRHVATVFLASLTFSYLFKSFYASKATSREKQTSFVI